MIAIVLALLAAEPAKPPASIDGLPIGGLAQQALPERGCAAYMFSRGTTRALVAMASADTAILRLSIDGVTADYARSGQDGVGGFGFARSTEYKAGDVTATLDMTIAAKESLTGGAMIPEATLRIDRPGKDGIILPVAGLIGCA